MTNTDTTTTTTTNTSTTNTGKTSPEPTTRSIDCHLEAYAMADADRRGNLIEAAWSCDGELFDPPLEGRGHAEISALADVVLTHYAGHRFVRTTAVDSHHGFARYGWNLTGPDGTVAVSGIDVVQFDDAGKLLRVVGFFGPLAPAS